MPKVEGNFLPVLKFKRERKGGATLELVHDVLKRNVFNSEVAVPSAVYLSHHLPSACPIAISVT